MKSKALVFGEIIWDVYPDKRVIGGAPLNFSAHMAHLGDETYLVSAVGEDKLGEAAYEELKKHGVKTQFVKKNGFPTGMCTVTLDENKVPSYYVHTGVAYDNIEINDEDIAEINSLGADVFYFNTLIQRSDVSKKSLVKILDSCSFEHIFCDVNIREGCFDAESLKLCMQRATIVKISDEEAHWLYDTAVLNNDGKDFMQSVASQHNNIKTVVYTKGAEGSAVLDAVSGKVYDSGKLPKVEVVSTVGAGDCFGATFLNCYLQARDIPTAIRTATERSNIVVASYEAIPF